MSSKCRPFNISCIFGNRKSHWGLDPVNRQGVPTLLNRREIDHWGDLGVDRWIILGWISRR